MEDKETVAETDLLPVASPSIARERATTTRPQAVQQALSREVRAELEKIAPLALGPRAKRTVNFTIR